MTSVSRKKSFLNFFPTPASLLLSTSGLAITDDSIKLIQFHRGLFGQSLKLSWYEKIPLPPGIVESGFINDAQKLTAILKDLAKGYDFRYVHATLPEERAYLFSATIDRVPREGLRDAVAFIIEQNVPVSLANSVFDFDVVEQYKESDQIKVMVSVLSKKVVDFYVQVLEAAGIRPVSFDIESQAIARAIVPQGDKQTQLIINAGLNKTGFYVVENEVVQFTTTLPYGSISSTGESHMGALKAEIKKIVVYWNTRGGVAADSVLPIEKVLLCGPSSLNAEFVTALMDESSMAYSLADVWVNAENYPSQLPEKFRQEVLDYTEVIGLALPHPHTTYV